MNLLLKISRLIDAINDFVGRNIYWLVLAAVIVSAVNAIVRKVFDRSSNAYLELQWYLFSAVFLLGAGYTLLRNAHVRIDIISSHYSKRFHTWMDIFGILIFLLPMALLTLWLSWPVFLDSWHSGEHSSNAGGLIVWPARLLVPAGFLLLSLQGISELIKRIAFLMGLIPDPLEAENVPTPEEELVAEIKAHGGIEQ